MNLLSIGASYGVLTAIFQYGWLADVIGLKGAVPIVSYVPLFMFAVLFGLSMNYETVVRCLLVPALMLLMGRVNWWMAQWLERIVPHVSIEGAEFFAARDRAARS